MALASSSEDPSQALLLAFPVEDLYAAVAVEDRHGMALLPSGAVGDLATCGTVDRLYLLEILPTGVAPAASWLATLLPSLALRDPDPSELLPETWRERHPHAYPAARGESGHLNAPAEIDPDDFPEAGEPDRQQVFLPVTRLAPIPRSEWLFTNELVRKQARGGRTFAPRVPTLITVPD